MPYLLFTAYSHSLCDNRTHFSKWNKVVLVRNLKKKKNEIIKSTMLYSMVIFATCGIGTDRKLAIINISKC